MHGRWGQACLSVDLSFAITCYTFLNNSPLAGKLYFVTLSVSNFSPCFEKIQDRSNLGWIYLGSWLGAIVYYSEEAIASFSCLWCRKPEVQLVPWCGPRNTEHLHGRPRPSRLRFTITSDL